MLDNVSVIIRSTGERTEDLCKYSILQNGIENDHIKIIKNVAPFSAALREGYKMALECDKKYTLFVDADLVLLPGSISNFLQVMDRMPSVIFFLNPLMYDYLSGYIMPGGPKLYRTEFLREAIKVIPDESQSLRPETFTSKMMREKGYEIIYLDYPCALHEREQYYLHIFSRIFNKFFKSKGKRKELETRINNLKNKNYDFAVAHKAIMRAKKEKGNFKLKLDYEQLAHIYEEYNIKEKESLDVTEENYQRLVKSTMADTKQYKLSSHTSKIWKAETKNKKGFFWK